jgi:hypothetical protein
LPFLKARSPGIFSNKLFSFYSAITQKFFLVRRLDAPRRTSLEDDPSPLGKGELGTAS